MSELEAKRRTFDLAAKERSFALQAETRGFALVAEARTLPEVVAGNGLLNNLIAYWPGNEVAGNALDLHTNALHLTDTNTVTSNPGLSYPLARQYTAANNEYHTRPGDDALLSTGDVDFTLAACARFDTFLINRSMVTKYLAATNNREYWLMFNQVTGRFEFRVSLLGTLATVTTVLADTLGVPAINTWYLIIGWHDSVANTINIEVNDGGVDSIAHAGGVFDSAATFEIGARTLADYMDGRIGPTAMWKSGPGLGGVKTPAERTALWNGGVPLTYAAFTV